jgi:hypothetical protein
MLHFGGTPEISLRSDFTFFDDIASIHAREKPTVGIAKLWNWINTRPDHLRTPQSPDGAMTHSIGSQDRPIFLQVPLWGIHPTIGR